jgi:GT2 family glycosyltransferase
MSVPYAVAIINYRTYADLDLCLGTLKRQSEAPEAIVVIDADPDLLLLETLERQYPEVIWMPSANRGYTGGANAGLDVLGERAPRSEYFLILNADIELETEFGEKLVSAMETDPSVALGSGKLLRSCRRLIDSTGIVMPANRRPYDRGSESLDKGQFDTKEYVFGASGAAMMIRRAALPSLSINGEVFDEDFFAYHDDTDLSWRAQRMGWKVLYAPEAVAVHGRRWQKGSRFEISPEVRRHSFKNHYLQIIKNEPLASFVWHLPNILFAEMLRMGFALVFDRAILKGYKAAWELMPKAYQKRKIIFERARSLPQQRWASKRDEVPSASTRAPQSR